MPHTPPQQPRSERDISTDRIARVIDEIQRGQRPPGAGSGEHRAAEECKQEARLTRLEDTVEEHTKQLGEGAQQFIRLEMGLANVAEKVGELIGVLKWAAFGLATFVFLLGGGVIVYVIAISGGKAVGVSP